MKTLKALLLGVVFIFLLACSVQACEDDFKPVHATPLPPSILLMGSGLAAVGLLRLRNRKK